MFGTTMAGVETGPASDGDLADPVDVVEADQAVLVAEIGRWARVEAMAAARRLAAIAELTARR